MLFSASLKAQKLKKQNKNKRIGQFEITVNKLCVMNVFLTTNS